MSRLYTSCSYSNDTEPKVFQKKQKERKEKKKRRRRSKKKKKTGTKNLILGSGEVPGEGGDAKIQ